MCRMILKGSRTPESSRTLEHSTQDTTHHSQKKENAMNKLEEYFIESWLEEARLGEGNDVIIEQSITTDGVFTNPKSNHRKCSNCGITGHTKRHCEKASKKDRIDAFEEWCDSVYNWLEYCEFEQQNIDENPDDEYFQSIKKNKTKERMFFKVGWTNWVESILFNAYCEEEDDISSIIKSPTIRRIARDIFKRRW